LKNSKNKRIQNKKLILKKKQCQVLMRTTDQLWRNPSQPYKRTKWQFKTKMMNKNWKQLDSLMLPILRQRHWQWTPKKTKREWLPSKKRRKLKSFTWKQKNKRKRKRLKKKRKDLQKKKESEISQNHQQRKNLRQRRRNP